MASLVRGNRIAYFRIKRGLSLRDLSLMSGVDSGTINRLENGLSKPRAKTVKALCDALDVSISELFDVDCTFQMGAADQVAAVLPSSVDEAVAKWARGQASCCTLKSVPP